MINDKELKNKLKRIWPSLNEQTRRIFAANEAIDLGRGGVSRVSRLLNISRVTILKGIFEIKSGTIEIGRIRKSGGGRHRIQKSIPNVLNMLEAIVESSTRGDPESPLKWTCKSSRNISQELTSNNLSISHTKVAHLLSELGFSLQGNKKTKEGLSHKDRNKQFLFINDKVKLFMKKSMPVISVDTKKKEIMGNYQNKGKQWLKKKSPKEVNSHDFPDPTLDRAFPYGIYDLANNTGFVNVGTDHDTGEFAVASIKGWWLAEGKKLYKNAKELLITADGGGSNGYRLRLWKLKLQELAQFTGLTIHVCHFPPGTSKWNKIEHRLFSFISSNWRGEPLVDYETIVNLISNTKTSKGLTVKCRLDRRKYPIGKKVSDEIFKKIKIKKNKFHGEWNYSILPK